MTPAQIDALLVANTPPAVPFTGPVGYHPFPARALAPGELPSIDAMGKTVPHLAAPTTAGSIYHRAALSQQEHPYYDREVRIDIKRDIITALDAKFGTTVYWPAAQARALLGSLDPVTGMYCTTGAPLPKIDPTNLPTGPAVRKQIGPADIPHRDPATGIMDAISGDPILAWSVHGADLLAWVASQP